MISFYYYLVLVSAVVTVAAAAAVFWRNRSQEVGPLLGFSLLVTALWLIGFAQYLAPRGPTTALRWAQFTLSCAVLSQPCLFHALCALVSETRRFKWFIVLAYLWAAVFLALLWAGQVIIGLKASPYMDHYIRYNHTLYPALGLHFLIWQFAGAGIIAVSARHTEGYKRTQLVYFLVAWFVEFLTTNSIILPLE